MENFKQVRKDICKEIDAFLKTYSRQVIQLKTLKVKLEETSNHQSIFKTQSISIQQMKEAIQSCDMGQYLEDKTLSNYAKEKKQVTFEEVQEEQKNEFDMQSSQKSSKNNQVSRGEGSNTIVNQRKINKKQGEVSQPTVKRQKESITKKLAQETLNSNQAGFNKYLSDYSIHILQKEHIDYPEIIDVEVEPDSPFKILFNEYCSIFTEDRYLLQQRLLRDIEDIQVYIKQLVNLSSKQEIIDLVKSQNESNSTYDDNIPFMVVQSAINKVKINKQQLDNQTIDILYPSFSQYVQEVLDLIKNKAFISKQISQQQQTNNQVLCQAWQMSIVQNIVDLVIQE